MATFVHIICDYGPGDLAWAEVSASMAAGLPGDIRFHLTSVGSFETIATGFVIAQLGLVDPHLRPENLLIFANTAPRKDRKDARTDNEGEGLLYGVLKNGVRVIAVNSGYSLSFIRTELNELWSTNVEQRGSQFRSRDFFPRVVKNVFHGDLTFQSQRLDPLSVCLEEPHGVVGYIDSFGNMKTTFREGNPEIVSLRQGRRLRVIVGSVVRTATVATGSFDVMEGDLAFAPGSSGHDRRYWELFKRGGSAWREFGSPGVGEKILLEEG